jgi:extradiol dioxygenase family protein
VEPHVRFKGKIGEQAAFFVEDPSGNCLEFKAFKERGDVFGT